MKRNKEELLKEIAILRKAISEAINSEGKTFNASGKKQSVVTKLLREALDHANIINKKIVDKSDPFNRHRNVNN